MESHGHQFIETLRSSDCCSDVNENGMGWRLNLETMKTPTTEEEPQVYSTKIDDLPDEILENIFMRLSPYNDLDSVKQVCQRWNQISTGTFTIYYGRYSSV